MKPPHGVDPDMRQKIMELTGRGTDPSAINMRTSTCSKILVVHLREIDRDYFVQQNGRHFEADHVALIRVLHVSSGY